MAGGEASGRNGKFGDKVLKKGIPWCSDRCPFGLCFWDLLIPLCPIWAGAVVGGMGTLEDILP